MSDNGVATLVKPTPLQILAFVVIGLALAAANWWMTAYGATNRWQRLAAPPSKITELVTHTSSVFVRTSDEELYACTVPITPWGQSRPTSVSECRLAELPPASAHGRVQKPCNRSSAAFSILTNAPREVADCLEFHPLYPDGYGLDVAVLDSEGGLWAWYVITTSNESLIGLGSLCLAPLVTVAIGRFVIVLVAGMNRKRI